MLSRAFVVLSLVAGCGNDTGLPVDRPDAMEAGPADVFRENCARCHGSDGAGTAKAPQILNPVEPYATYVVRNGRGIEMGFADEMPMFAADQISDAELASIWKTLGAVPKPTTGKELYLRFCGNCHGADAWGGRVEKAITDELDELHETVRDGEGGTSYGEREEYMPAWTAAKLTNAELDLIAAYLSTVPPAPEDEDEDEDEETDEAARHNRL